jgi:hypothetical protein
MDFYFSCHVRGRLEADRCPQLMALAKHRAIPTFCSSTIQALDSLLTYHSQQTKQAHQTLQNYHSTATSSSAPIFTEAIQQPFINNSFWKFVTWLFNRLQAHWDAWRTEAYHYVVQAKFSIFAVGVD